MSLLIPNQTDEPENINTNGKIFIGREEELSKLYDLTLGHRAGFGPITIMITGVGGIGKSALVEAFVTLHIPQQELLWINLENSPNPITVKVDEIIKEQRRKFPKRRFVVVLDGAESLNSKQLDFGISRLSNLKPIRTLIVTARTAPRLRGINYLNLSHLSISDSVLLLISYFSNRISNEDIVKLATALNGNPLALNLAIDFLKTHSIDEVWKFIEGEIYNLESATGATTDQLVKVVQPQIVLATDTLIKNLKKSPMDIYQVSSRQFEEIVAYLLSGMGWEVELTKETRDGGRDILAYMQTDLDKFLCLVEAKRYNIKRPVGVELIRTLYGTFCHYQANKAMMVTTSRFSKDAREFQKQHELQLSLREYTDVIGWIQKHKNL